MWIVGNTLSGKLEGVFLFELDVIKQCRFNLWRLIESKTDETKPLALSALKVPDILLTTL